MLRPVSRPFALAALLVSSLLMAPRLAAAATLDDPAVGLHVTLDTPGAQVCVVLPVASRDPVGCGELDVEKAAAAMLRSDKTVAGVALIRFPEWNLVVTLKTNLGVAVRSAEDIESFLGGVKKGSAGVGLTADQIRIHNDTSSASYDIGKVKEVNYLRTHLDFDVSADSPLHGGSRSLLYLFDGKDTSEMLLFSTDPAHLAAAQPIAQAIARTVVLPPSRFEGYGEPRALAIARMLGRVTVPLVMTLACIVLVLRSWWKKRRAAAR